MKGTEGRSQQDVVKHLEAAARELIAAGQAALDVADELVSDGIRMLGRLFGGRGDPADRPDPPKVERIEVRVDEP